jgi:predicted PurR-regulated permease PerM
MQRPQMWDSKLLKAGVAVLLFFLIILIGTQISFIFRPLIITFEVFFYAFLISGALYYAMIPLVDWLAKHRVPRKLSVVITYLVFIAVVTGLVALVGPSLQKEFTILLITLPDKIDQILALFESLKDTVLFGQIFGLEAFSIEKLSEMIPNAINNSLNYTLNSITLVLDFVTGFFVTLVVTPFLLYYMLAESGNGSVASVVSKLAPRIHAERTRRSIAEINNQLALYVQGVGLVCLMVGILAYIGFIIIDIEFAMVLAVFVLITNIIPIIGPFIGAVPAVLVGAINSPLMVLKVIIVIVIVQQLDAMLVRPQVVGRKLAISPLAIILVVLLAGRLGGLIGIILAVPIFTVIKIVFTQVYETIRSTYEAENDH